MGALNRMGDSRMARTVTDHEFELKIDGFPCRAVIRQAGAAAFYVREVQPLGFAPDTIMSLAKYGTLDEAIDAAREHAEVMMEPDEEG
jgi:hypothetical protein